MFNDDSNITILRPDITTGKPGIIKVSELTGVYSVSQSGDLVIVKPGTYDIGNNSIQLKDGVNWKFMPGVTITSDSTDGTFKDGGATVDVIFDGDPLIQNTNGNNKLIVLVASSSVDFKILFDVEITLEKDSSLTIANRKSIYQLPSATAAYDSQEIFYNLTFVTPLPGRNQYLSQSIITSFDDGLLRFIKPEFYSNTVLNLTIYDDSFNNKTITEDRVVFICKIICDYRKAN